MKKLMAGLTALLLVLALPAAAHQYKVGGIVLHHPWARATPPGATVAAAYVEIINKGAEADRLVSVTSPIAEVAEIHDATVVDGVSKMRRIEGGLEIAAGATVEIKPGGIHIMLMRLKDTLVENVPVKATLIFEKAGAIEVELVVEKVGATSSEEK